MWRDWTRMERDFAQWLLGVGLVVWSLGLVQDVKGCSAFIAESLIAVPHIKKMITSPHYPNFYPDNDERCWRIKAVPGYVVNLETADFQVEIMLGVPCGSADYLEIRDGYYETSPLLRKMCGIEHINMTSTGDSMYLKFKSDESVSQTGFRLMYQAIHSSASIGPQGDPLQDSCSEVTKLKAMATVAHELQSPNFPNGYPSSVDRCWLIEAYDRDMVILVTLLESVLEDNYSCESGDFVQAFDGTDMTDKQLAIFCGDTYPDGFRSTGSHLLLRFHTDQTSNNYRGFHLEYIMVEPNTGNGDKKGLSLDQTMQVLIGVGVAVIALAVIFAVIGIYKKSGHTHVHAASASSRRASRQVQQTGDTAVRLAFESILNQPMRNMRVTQANLRAPPPYEGPQRPPTHLGFVAPTQPGYSPWVVPSSNKRHRHRGHRDRAHSLTVPATIRQYHDTMFPPGTPIPPEPPPYEDIIKALEDADWGGGNTDPPQALIMADNIDTDATSGNKEESSDKSGVQPSAPTLSDQQVPPGPPQADSDPHAPLSPPQAPHSGEDANETTGPAIPGSVDG